MESACYNIRNLDSIRTFNSFIKLLPNKISDPFIPQELKFLGRLQLGLSHLCDYKVKRNFLENFIHCFYRSSGF